MLYVTIAFLWVSLLIYLLTGGADYGYGILELFSFKQNRASIRQSAYQLIGPVWEANHMWLIIAVVILFVGFPDIFTTASIYLHIPLVIMLLGIIARGTSFTFRNYDAVEDKMQAFYNRIYVYSSFITPFFLGVIAGSAVSGQIDPQSSDFTSGYIFDWLNAFSFSVGFFTVFLCGFLAAVYLRGNARLADEKRRYSGEALKMVLAMAISVVSIFASAVTGHIPLVKWVFGSSVPLLALFFAIVSLVMLFRMLHRGRAGAARLSAGLMLASLLVAVTYSHFPEVIILKNGGSLSLRNPAYPRKTMEVLGSALLIGSIFILPALGYLLYSFDLRNTGDAPP